MTQKNEKTRLKLENLTVSLRDEPARQLLADINVELATGETLVLLGPNGAGKSTLGKVIAGLEKYRIETGKIEYQGEVINDWTPEARARAGVFLSWQEPPLIEGVKIADFLRLAREKCTGEQLSAWEWRQNLINMVKNVDLQEEIIYRDLGDGLSGGEKKKLEMLQLELLAPKLAIVDEIDAGLDVDALKTVRDRIGEYQKNGANSLILITHTTEILAGVRIDKVLIMSEGKIIKTGGQELIARVQTSGYSGLEEEE